MKRTIVLAVIAMLILGACSSKERAVTGTYGDGVLTGQVAMSEGGSAAGVDVSVSGTGMTTRLGADGQFAFAGVPDGAELVFQRAADGINATMRLESASGHVMIDLTKSEAKKSGGRRRAAGSSKTYQFEGLVESASATQVVVNTAREQVTIALTEATLIRRGGTPLTAADLVAGLRVHVKALKVTAGFTAVQIVVQGDDDDDENDDDRPSVREYEGTVVSATATQLVIFSSKKKEETFVVDADTDIRKGNTPVLAADIQPGWRVHVKAATSEDGATKTAQRVIVQNTKTKSK
jgi:hypothetical protein